MSDWQEKWELVVGLEVHAQLLTESKAYSADPNAYGDHPNTNISAVTLGLPGTLPVMNAKTVELAIRLGLACECTVASRMWFARKNYFYPDLPKGYQITQDNTPINTGGRIVYHSGGEDKVMRLVRIHMEEDAGKSIHDIDPFNTLVDLNRAGVPLLEIVSEPDLRSSQEAYDYLVEVRRLLRYLDICDGNMEEGSMRCDANISVRPKGSSTLGTRTEVKNLNSFRNVQRAIEFEAARQVEVLEAGGRIAQETRTFDAAKGVTIGMRSKEMAHDYRYFPEPDLGPLTVSEARKEAVRKAMPPLPRELKAKYMNDYGLSAYDAAILTDDKETALYYEAVIARLPAAQAGPHHRKVAANWVMGPVRSWINERGLAMAGFPVGADRIAELVELVEAGAVSHTQATQKLFPLLFESDARAADLARQHDLVQVKNDDLVERLAREAMDRYPEKVAAYRSGQKGLLGLFMGEVMKGTKGKADPKAASEVVKRVLES